MLKKLSSLRSYRRSSRCPVSVPATDSLLWTGEAMAPRKRYIFFFSASAVTPPRVGHSEIFLIPSDDATEHDEVPA